MYKVLLWDVDNTLLDFSLAEKSALKTCFEKFSLGECSDETVKRYSEINAAFWRRLEAGEMTKEEIMLGRFEELLSILGVTSVSARVMNEEFERRLADTVVPLENSLELVKELSQQYRQYAVTNGAYSVQSLKIKKAGLDELMDGVFISDAVGADKPSVDFFGFVLDNIPPCEKSEILIIGDSLTGDMQGGNNIGIDCCWYNPAHNDNKIPLKIDYEIRSLNEIKNILK